MTGQAFAKHRCPGCGHTYDERHGNPREGFPPGTRWEAIPADWTCPDCAVCDKQDFARLDA